MQPSPPWFFFGRAEHAPTVGQLVEGLMTLGYDVRVERPKVDRAGRQVGRAKVDPYRLLLETPLYLTLAGASGGMLGLSSSAPSEAALETYRALESPARVPEQEIGVVASVSAWDTDESAPYRELMRPVLCVLGELFPSGVCYREGQRQLYPTDGMRDRLEPQRQRLYHFNVNLGFPEWTMPMIRSRIAREPVLRELTYVNGRSFRIVAPDVYLSEEDWGAAYLTLLECARSATGGTAQIVCEGEFETSLHPMGAQERTPTPAPMPVREAFPRTGRRVQALTA